MKKVEDRNVRSGWVKKGEISLGQPIGKRKGDAEEEPCLPCCPVTLVASAGCVSAS